MSDKKEAVNWRRRLARWEKNPPEVPIALGPVTGDVVTLAYRAKDGTLGIALFKNTYVFSGATPQHVQAYIRSIAARHHDDLSESRRHASKKKPAPLRQHRDCCDGSNSRSEPADTARWSPGVGCRRPWLRRQSTGRTCARASIVV